MGFHFRLLLAGLLFTVLPATAQSWKNLSADEIFHQARGKAFEGDREEARAMLLYALEKSPEYTDLRILLGRTYAWDGLYEEGRKHLRLALKTSPRYDDAFLALADLELWAHENEVALNILDSALMIFPTHNELLYKRGIALNNLSNIEEATLTLSRLLALNPAHADAAALLAKIKTDQLKYTVGLRYNVDAFTRIYDPAHYAAVQVGRNNKWGSSIVRINYADRFETNGIQAELDLYPRITDGIYAFLNYGYSATALFPMHRLGSEIFTKLPESFEASAGARYLVFSGDRRVTIFTGSLGWYYRSLWLSVRPYITTDQQAGTAFSMSGTLRRYFADTDSFVGLSGGFGFNPDERRLQSGAGLTSGDIFLLRVRSVGLAFSKTVSSTLIVTASVGYSRQELGFDQADDVDIVSIAAAVTKRF